MIDFRCQQPTSDFFILADNRRILVSLFQIREILFSEAFLWTCVTATDKTHSPF